MRFSHVVLDLDGTLVDTTASQTVALNDIIAQHGRAALDSRTVRSIAGHGLRAMLREAFHITGNALPDVELNLALKTLRVRYDSRMLELTVCAPGVQRTMRELHETGVKLSVLSNKPQIAAVALLDHAGITNCIDLLVAGDMGYPRKPDPQGLVSLMASAGTDITNTVMCGSMRIDMQTARNAGIACAACSPFIDPSEVVALGGDYALLDIGQLLPLCTGRAASGSFRAV